MQALYRLKAESGKPALAPAARWAYLKLIRENCSEVPKTSRFERIAYNEGLERLYFTRGWRFLHLF